MGTRYVPAYEKKRKVLDTQFEKQKNILVERFDSRFKSSKKLSQD